MLGFYGPVNPMRSCRFVLVVVFFFFLNQIFSLFPIVKRNAEICKVGKLEADFQQVLHVPSF